MAIGNTVNRRNRITRRASNECLAEDCGHSFLIYSLCRFLFIECSLLFLHLRFHDELTVLTVGRAVHQVSLNLEDVNERTRGTM